MLEPGETGRFKTPIMQAIKDANPDGVMSKNKRKVIVMSVEMLNQRISDVDDALSCLLSWYHKNIFTQSTVKYGDVLISEL